MFQRIIGIMCLIFSVWYVCQGVVLWQQIMMGIMGICGVYFILGKDVI